MTQLEEQHDAGRPLDGTQLAKLIKLLKSERDCMTENFRVTNRAYVLLDKQNRELREYINTHLPKPNANPETRQEVTPSS
jgi:hypothetical protein